eukprot:2906727-Pleurochrysis_carterae.AAC.1
MRLVKIRAAGTECEEQRPVQQPEHVRLEKKPICEDHAAVCGVQATHVLGVTRGEGERGETVWRAED